MDIVKLEAKPWHKTHASDKFIADNNVFRIIWLPARNYTAHGKRKVFFAHTHALDGYFLFSLQDFWIVCVPM